MGKGGKAPQAKRTGAKVSAALQSPAKRRTPHKAPADPYSYEDDVQAAHEHDDQGFEAADPAGSMDVDMHPLSATEDPSDADAADEPEAAFDAVSGSEDEHDEDDDNGAGGGGGGYTGGHAGAGPSSAAAQEAEARPAATRDGRKRTSGAAAAQKQQDHSGAGLAGMLPADLDDGALRGAWQALPVKHKMHKEDVLKQRRLQFPRWRLQLRQRFSLLFYGFGCKRRLLQAFAMEALTDGAVLEINGHQAAVDSKMVLAAAANLLTHRSFKGSSHLEMLAAINSERQGRHVYVLLHNIDGPGLRAPEDQLWLSRLSQCRSIHLLASVDHANAALLWDRRSAMRFRWLWQDVTSYEHYEVETMHMAPILTGCLQSAARRGAATVLPSLVSSARAVFKILAEHQLDDPEAIGTTLGLLYSKCRERFLLNTEAALRAHLAEFKDHELVKWRPGEGGGEVMYIPMEPEVLQRVVDEMEDAAGA